MMRILTSFVTVTALLLTAGLIGCTPDPDDVFTTISTTATTQTTLGDGDGDTSGGTGTSDGTGTGDGDGDPGCADGSIGTACDATCLCAEGLTCDDTGTCSLGSGDGDGDGDGDPGGDCNTYDPMMCMMPGQLVMVMGLEGNFCGCPCAADADCPMGPPGTNGGCVLVLDGGMTPTTCALICSVMSDSCPAGSTCKSAGQSDPDLGLCTFP